MGRIGVESPASDREHYQVTTSPHAKAGRLPIQVARHEMVWRTVVGGKANDGGHGPSWCALQRNECKTAPSVYREVVTGGLNCHSGSYQGAFERLDAKVSRAVLRGLGASNGPWLPDYVAAHAPHESLSVGPHNTKSKVVYLETKDGNCSNVIRN